MSKRGLTLIELLVVIAIIGLLASVFLVNLIGARARARDTRVMVAMAQIRTRATIIYHETEKYTEVKCVQIGDPCKCKDPTIKILCTDIFRNAVPGTIVFSVVDDAYCVEAQLPGSGKFWCIDSNLNSKVYDNNPPCSPAIRSCTL